MCRGEHCVRLVIDSFQVTIQIDTTIDSSQIAAYELYRVGGIQSEREPVASRAVPGDSSHSCRIFLMNIAG